ncbi:MAG: hypothetical protein HYU44_13450, partial [Betaproteobacteria bacterium]|nr:hypothetical protein [Betaproteobacteria bacterium]
MPEFEALLDPIQVRQQVFVRPVGEVAVDGRRGPVVQAKLESKQQKCKLCKNFFSEKINELSKSISKKLDKIEFNTFLVGSVPSHEMLNDEEKLQERLGIEFSETIKSEMNRELGKAIEKITGKHFDLKIPDVTIVV